MAKVLQPLMSAEASGKLGGICYFRSRSGPAVRSFTGINRHSRYISKTTESFIINLGHLWNKISDFERNSWNLGANGKLSGYNLFRQRNLRILRAYPLPVTLYSNILPPSIPSFFEVFLSNSVISITSDFALSGYDVLQVFILERKHIGIKADFSKAHLFANIFDFVGFMYFDYQYAASKNIICWFRILNIESGNISPLILGS